MNETQTRIYNYIHAIWSINKIPVMITYHNIAEKLGVKEITIKRNLDDMILNKHIYRRMIGNCSIYDFKPIDTNNDFVCYVRNKI